MIRWFLGGEDGMAGGGGEARTISLCSVALSGMRVISDGRWLFVLHCEMLRTVIPLEATATYSSRFPCLHISFSCLRIFRTFMSSRSITLFIHSISLIPTDVNPLRRDHPRHLATPCAKSPQFISSLAPLRQNNMRDVRVLETAHH
jgi:hypothetical protein